MSQAYQAAVGYLYSLHRFGIKLGLSNIRNLLRASGNPQERAPVIHIAGTNGKGSVAAFIQSILRRQGYKAGLFTSPHLQEFRERIRINDEYISQEDMVRHYMRIRRTLERNAGDFDPPARVTFFEFATAMACSYFAEQGVDFAIMEVGLGGRLDATNVVHPLLTVITNIQYDHTHYLGRTLGEIAREKCGIIKEGVPVVTSPQISAARETIAEVAARSGSPLTWGEKDYRWKRTEFSLEGQTFDYRERDKKLEGLRIRLLGGHQAGNAALAVASCLRLEEAGYSITEEALREGLENTSWPGRLEVVSREPCVILDGAHNPAAARVLVDAMKEMFPRANPVLVFGAMADKDYSNMLAELVPMARRVILTRPDMARSADTRTLRESASLHGIDVRTAGTVARAMDMAMEGVHREDVVLVTGSLFLVGEARRCLRFQDA